MFWSVLCTPSSTRVMGFDPDSAGPARSPGAAGGKQHLGRAPSGRDAQGAAGAAAGGMHRYLISCLVVDASTMWQLTGGMSPRARMRELSYASLNNEGCTCRIDTATEVWGGVGDLRMDVRERSGYCI
eukprot:1240640-Pleurochrysis_carterae.AAC.3